MDRTPEMQGAISGVISMEGWNAGPADAPDIRRHFPHPRAPELQQHYWRGPGWNI
jgi:hypothetical protein